MSYDVALHYIMILLGNGPALPFYSYLRSGLNIFLFRTYMPIIGWTIKRFEENGFI